MFFEWVKVLVGAFLILNFSIPTLAIARNSRLLEDPTPLLVFNMTAAAFVFGTSLLGVGVLDMLFAGDVPLPLCVSVQYLLIGSALTTKAAAVYLAVDQFVAIVHPLHHPTIMGNWMRRMLLLTWCWIPIVGLYGLVCYQLEMETAEDFDHRMFGTQGSLQECHWTQAAFVVTTFLEGQLLLMSLTLATLFVYTAFKGLQQQRRDNLRGHVNETSHFFLRFKSFKRIVKVLLILLTLDIIGSGFRISIHWWPQVALIRVMNFLRLLSLVAEAWTYGLSYPAVRCAIRELFRSRSSQQDVRERPEVRRPRPNVIEVLENNIERSLRF